jgi:hypothetical protein
MPQIYLIAGLAWAASVAAAGWYGMELGDDRCIARAAKAQTVEDRAVAAAAMAAASAVAAIEVKQITIRGRVEREIRENVRYVDCRHTPDGLRDLNSALTGNAADPGKLPPATAASR